MTLLDLITRLQENGYTISLDRDKGSMRYRYTRHGEPPVEKVQALFEELKKRKQEAIVYIDSLKQNTTGKPYAVKIRSKVLDADVWVVTHPEAIPYIPDGDIYFLPEEIRNLRGATPDEIRAVYFVKKELGGRLISVKEIEGIA